MNNRAAEALVQGKIDDAYWWAREALVQSPAFMSPVQHACRGVPQAW
jgi:hypothetical protein